MKSKWLQWGERKGDFSDLTRKAFSVSKADLVSQNYDLSINRYKQTVYVAEKYDNPRDILKRMSVLETEIQKDLAELDGLLG